MIYLVWAGVSKPGPAVPAGWMMTLIRTLFSVAAFLLMAALAPHSALAAPDELTVARNTVQAAVDEGLDRFVGKSYSLAERTRLLDGLLRRYTDPSMLSSAMLGRYWGKITPAEQAAFTDTFMRYLVSSYVGLLKNLQAGTRVQVGEAVDLGARIRVFSIAHMPSDPTVGVPVDWDVAPAPDGRPVIMDVSAEGVSIIRAMREDFASVLRGSGGRIAPLMDALQRKIEANDRDNMVGQ